MRKVLVPVLALAANSCGLVGAPAAIDITVEVDPTALQRICRDQAGVCWPQSKDGLKAVVHILATETNSLKKYPEKIGERDTPGTLTFRLEDLPDGDYQLDPYTLQPPEWGQIAFEPALRRVLIKSGADGHGTFRVEGSPGSPLLGYGWRARGTRLWRWVGVVSRRAC